MSKMSDIAGELQQKLSQRYAQVRLSAIQTPEQFIHEIKALNVNKLPAAVITFDGMQYRYPDGIVEYNFTVVVIDRFVAGNAERALSVLRAGDDLLTMFPADGCTLADGVFVVPDDCMSASPDAAFAAMALGLRCQAGM